MTKIIVLISADTQHASRLVMGGASLPMVMKWMGHSQWSTTLGYAHLAPNALTHLRLY